jgi:hypothetical protein
MKRVSRKGWRQSRLGRLADYGLGLLLVLFLIYSLSVSAQPSVSVSDTAYHPVKDYQEAANGLFAALKNRNKVTLDEQGIAKRLKATFPEISDITIRLPLIGQTPRLYIEVSKPVIQLDSQGRAYVINSDGKAAGDDGSLAKFPGLIRVEDQSGFEIKLGQPVLSAGEVAFIRALDAQARKNAVAVASLNLPPRPQELNLRTADKGYYVKFYLGGNAASQIGQWLASRAQFEREGGGPGEYLDVRVPGKVFIK